MTVSTAPRRAQAGFSLLEVLIAMGVLSIGAASVLALFAAAASSHRRSVERTRAALVAERVLAEAQLVYTLGRSAKEVREELKRRLPEVLDGYRYEATIVRPRGESWSERELFLHLEVRWRHSGRTRAETFDTILLPRVRGL